MTGLPYPVMDDDARAQYRVFPINLTKMLLHTRGLTLPYLRFAWSFRNGWLSASVRERVIIRVAALTDCDYELLQHRPEALRTGMTEVLLAQLMDTTCHEFGDTAVTALVGFVDSLVNDHGATPEALESLREHHPDGEVAEITLLAGTYLLCATFLISLQVPLDEHPVDWAAADVNLGGIDS